VYPHLDAVMKTLLRTYEGVFEHRVSINEKLLAKIAKLPYEKIYADLKVLHGYGIIDYLPQKETPQIYFLLNRASTRHLQFNGEVYNQRKQLYEQRVAAMLNYIELKTDCRSKHISAYFGDATVKDCGICDNCLAKKSNEITTEEFKKIEAIIYAQILTNGIAIQLLMQRLKYIKKEKLHKVMEFLQSEKLIIVNELGIVKKA
jgi:ATP-dependent DNA helicase RecQ